jgi:hypothetical protein
VEHCSYGIRGLYFSGVNHGKTMYFMGRWTYPCLQACIARALFLYFQGLKRGTEEEQVSSGRILLAFGTHLLERILKQRNFRSNRVLLAELHV